MQTSSSKNFTKKGFTLVETLVAIAVLMIAVAGPLVIANKALTSALYARDQSAASYLAQEEMEIIKNTRDNNLKGSTTPLPWLNSIDSCVNGNMCDLTHVNGFSSVTSGAGADGYPLYLGSNGYDHDPGSGTKTLFSRYFTLTQIDPNDYKIEVGVSWNEGTVPNKVTLHSELVNAVR